MYLILGIYKIIAHRGRCGHEIDPVFILTRHLIGISDTAEDPAAGQT